MGKTCECGLNYVRGLDEDEKHHAKIHEEYACGPRFPVLEHLSGLCLMDGFTFHAIDRSVPYHIRRELAYAAMVACRSIPGPAGYDGTETEDDLRLYLLAAGSHVVAMVITALDSYFWKLGWGDDGSIRLLEQQAHLRTAPKVARVWVAANYRRKGLATALVIEASKHLGVDVQMLGWELPFTEGGSAFVRKLSPEDFFGCCEVFTLREILEGQ